MGRTCPTEQSSKVLGNFSPQRTCAHDVRADVQTASFVQSGQQSTAIVEFFTCGSVGTISRGIATSSRGSAHEIFLVLLFARKAEQLIVLAAHRYPHRPAGVVARDKIFSLRYEREAMVRYSESLFQEPIQSSVINAILILIFIFQMYRIE